MSTEGSRKLEELENWFQSEIVRPHETSPRAAGVRSAVASATTPLSATSWVLPSQHLQPEQRVAIYSDMYFARLVECMLADYPALAHIMGAEAFEKLVRAYMRRFPSHHYSLNVLGRHLPEFLAGPVRIPRRALLHDVAKLEQAMTVVFDAPRSQVLSSAELAQIAPETWESARPTLIDALILATFDHRANAIVTAARHQASLPDLKRTKTWVAIYRKDYVVWRMELSHPMYAVLRALSEHKTLFQAIEAGARVFKGSSEQLQTQIFTWFAEWVGEGFFSAID